jgi:hypothetical protein
MPAESQREPSPRSQLNEAEGENAPINDISRQPRADGVIQTGQLAPPKLMEVTVDPCLR